MQSYLIVSFPDLYQACSDTEPHPHAHIHTFTPTHADRKKNTRMHTQGVVSQILIIETVLIFLGKVARSYPSPSNMLWLFTGATETTQFGK